MTENHPCSADEHIGFKARELREAAQLSPDHVASALSISVEQLREMEAGQSRASSAMLVDMSKLYECELSDFFPAFAGFSGKSGSSDNRTELINLKLACIDAVLENDDEETLRGSLLMLQKNGL